MWRAGVRCLLVRRITAPSCARPRIAGASRIRLPVWSRGTSLFPQGCTVYPVRRPSAFCFFLLYCHMHCHAADDGHSRHRLLPSLIVSQVFHNFCRSWVSMISESTVRLVRHSVVINYHNLRPTSTLESSCDRPPEAGRHDSHQQQFR